MSRAALAQGIVVVLAPVVAGCAAQIFSSADGGAGDAASVTAAGGSIGGGVWTGTRADGGVGNFCPTGSTPTSGVVTEVGKQWTDQTFFVATCGSSLALYCFQTE